MKGHSLYPPAGFFSSNVPCAHLMTDHQIATQIINCCHSSVARARTAFFEIDPGTPMPAAVEDQIRAAYLSGISQASSFLVRGDGLVTPQQLERASVIAGTHFGFESRAG
jgi:hypothetical protein